MKTGDQITIFHGWGSETGEVVRHESGNATVCVAGELRVFGPDGHEVLPEGWAQMDGPHITVT